MNSIQSLSKKTLRPGSNMELVLTKMVNNVSTLKHFDPMIKKLYLTFLKFLIRVEPSFSSIQKQSPKLFC